MYRKEAPGQLRLKNFYLPFGGKLSAEKRWVKLSELIPWEECEEEYAEQFSEGVGAPAKPFRMALGALIIKEKLRISDEETVEKIRENPYLQYFIGMSEYSDRAPFEASMMVHLRKRVKLEMVGRVNEALVNPSSEEESTSEEEGKAGEDDERGRDGGPPVNQRKLILDASCNPADIHYPTDLRLLNKAREQTESVIDVLCQQVREKLKKKPRSYCQRARKGYLSIAKKRRPYISIETKGCR